jgi:hypothetical protein
MEVRSLPDGPSGIGAAPADIAGLTLLSPAAPAGTMQK